MKIDLIVFIKFGMAILLFLLVVAQIANTFLYRSLFKKKEFVKRTKEENK